MGNKQLEDLSGAQEKKKKIPIIFGRGLVCWATGEPGLSGSIGLFCLHVTL